MKKHSSDFSGSEPIVMLPATASEAFSVGECLKLVLGKATKASETDTAAYVCVGKVAADSGDVPAIRVNKETIYACTLSAAGTALNIGDKVTIAADGINVTATTASGVAELVGFDGKASGDTVYVRL